MIGLAAAVILEERSRLGKGPQALDPEAARLVAILPWNGGWSHFVTILGHLAKEAGSIIRASDVLAAIHAADAPSGGPVWTLRDASRRFERHFIEAALAEHHGQIHKAASALGVHRPNLYRKLRALGLSRELAAAAVPLADPPLPAGSSPVPVSTLREAKAEFEREYILAVLDRHRGRIAEAARVLGIQRPNLYRKMRSLRLKPARSRRTAN